MCTDCGCGDPDVVPLEIQARILSDNDRGAAHNRHHFEEAGVVAINVMGSPGSGKTALLEATARGLPGARKVTALSGDLATDNDAARLLAAGIGTAATITTGTACHLDAALVHRALHDLAWRGSDYLFIENVGNLVCPAVYDLGQHRNVVVLSVTEGEDKPLKYPVMFKDADLVVITKTDLLPLLPHVSLAALHDNLSRVMPNPTAIELSALGGAGVGAWIEWLERLRRSLARPQGHAPHPSPA
ncbi:MAG: hydrogenase nickel incorporation protein HypB [Nannocystaceae bacterium]